MRHVSQTVLLIVSTVTFVEIEELDSCVKQVTFTSLCAYFQEKMVVTQLFTEDMMSVDMPQLVVSTVMLTSTQTVTFTPSCSMPMTSVYKPQPVVSTIMLTSTQTVTFTPSCSILVPMSTTSASGASSCSVLTSTTTVVSTPSCTAQRVGPQFLGIVFTSSSKQSLLSLYSLVHNMMFAPA